MSRRIGLLSRLAREGYVPAGPARAVGRGMLVPKPRERRRNPVELNYLPWLAGKLGPPERRALREICETGDIVVYKRRTFIVACVSSATLEALAAFEAEGEDREVDYEDDRLDGDGPHGEGHIWEDREPDHDDDKWQDVSMNEAEWSDVHNV